MLTNIAIPHAQIVAFCERHHIRKMALFGSILGDKFTPNSDIDVLVEFDPNHIPGWEFVSMQDELSAIFERKVDLNTYGFLSETFGDAVVNQAMVIYER